MHNAYKGLTPSQQKNVYLIATSQENQQRMNNGNFCRKAANGMTVAECTNDKISTEWFDGNTNPRYIIWFFRDPNINCQWSYHGRYSTNGYRDVRTSLQQTMLRLLTDSSICTADETQTTVKSAVSDRVVTTITRKITTANRVTTTTSFQSTRLPNDDRCPIVIDVRTQLEWDEGHAACAHRLEIQNDATLVDKVLELANGDPTYPLQLYCRSGNRSGKAVKILQEQGFTHVTNAGGWHSGEIDAIKKLCDCTVATAVCPKCGINKKSGKRSCCARGGAWFAKCGDTDNPNFDHTWGEGIEACALDSTINSTILPLTRLPNDEKCPIVIDVRTQLEWNEGHAACAYRFEIQSYPTLVDKVLELANGDLTYPLQLHSGSGNRAERAVKVLQESGFTHVTNAGGWRSGEMDAIKKLCECNVVKLVCPKCAVNKKSGEWSCCALGGAWFQRCGDTDKPNFDHTWKEGIKACAGAAPATDAGGAVDSNTCPKCGTNKNSGKRSCCAPGGSWSNNCGEPGDKDFEHTWFEGLQACEEAPMAIITPTKNKVCINCGELKTGEASCCGKGGDWANKCGNADDPRFYHSWSDGLLACESRATAAVNISVCPKCGTNKKSGERSCCAAGGAWVNNCGKVGDTNFDYTWLEGRQACAGVSAAMGAGTTRVSVNICPKCGIAKKSGKRTCCAPGGSWVDNCGDPGDTNFEHTWSEGRQACEGVSAAMDAGTTTVNISDINVCPKCGIAKKSGKRTCCAPGGSWVDNCGDPGDTNFEHTWSEGRQACEGVSAAMDAGTTRVSVNICPKCGIAKKSGKRTCCAPGGSWVDNCGDPGDTNFEHTWSEGRQACKDAPEEESVQSIAMQQKHTEHTPPVSACPECGIDTESGKPSCCAVGGSWVNKCGEPGDTDFDHTWFEGILACEERTPTRNVLKVIAVDRALQVGLSRWMIVSAFVFAQVFV